MKKSLMTDEDRFLQAILENPEPDRPRLIFANWLERRGDPWGEFIRTQCTLVCMPHDDARRKELESRERELLAKHQAVWIGQTWWTLEQKRKVFRRGFLEEIRDVVAANVPHIVRYTRCLAPRLHVEIDVSNSYGFRFSKLVTDPCLTRITGLMIKNEKYYGRAVWVGDGGVQLLAQSPYATNLTMLGLRDCDITDLGMLELATSRQMPRLTSLNLSDNHITDDGLAFLADCPNLRSLTALDLSHNDIGNAGLRALAASPHFPALSTIDLRRNDRLDDQAIDSILRSPNFSQLNELHIHMGVLLSSHPEETRVVVDTPKPRKKTSPNDAADSILSLAEASLQRYLLPEEVREQAERLLEDGLHSGGIPIALEAALRPDCPTPRVEMVAQICIRVLEVSGSERFASRVHVDVATAFLERDDVLSLSLAADHYLASRVEIGSNTAEYGGTLLNEGAACQRLAILGESPLKNLARASKLFSRAAEVFAPGSAEHRSCLMNEANARYQLAAKGDDSVENLLRAVHLYKTARHVMSPPDEDYGIAFLEEGNARQLLAEVGVEPKKNFRSAVRLFSQARNHFSPQTADYGGSLMNEGNSRQQLADMGVNPCRYLQRALSLYGEARPCFSPDTEDFGRLLMNEAAARVAMAGRGVEPRLNLKDAEQAILGARDCFAPETPLYAKTQLIEANLRVKWAELGINAADNYLVAVQLNVEARSFLPNDLYYRPLSILNEANARLCLAELSHNSVEQLRAALAALKSMRWNIRRSHPCFGIALLAEGNVLYSLAALGVEPWRNLQDAIIRYAEAREHIPPESIHGVYTLMNEAAARVTLIRFGEDARKSLRTAIRLLTESRRRLGTQSVDFGTAAMNEGIAWVRLAEFEEEPRAILEQAMGLFETARACFQAMSCEWARVVVNEGNAHVRLAEIGVEPERNLRTAQELFGRARPLIPCGHPDLGLCDANEANVRLKLAELGVDEAENLRMSADLSTKAALAFGGKILEWGSIQLQLARIFRAAGRLGEEYEHLKRGLGVPERLRGQFLQEKERIAYSATVSKQYQAIVEVCVALACDAQSDAPKFWRREAWHWAQRAKNRVLLDAMASARPRLSTKDMSRWEKWQALGEQIKKQAQEIEDLQRRLGAERIVLLFHGQSEITRRLVLLTVEHKELCDTWDRTRQELIEQVEETRPLLAVEPDPPEEVAGHLRKLAGLDCPIGFPVDATSAQLARRPLLVDFFCLSHDVVVFLLPLWRCETPLVVRLDVNPEHILATVARPLLETVNMVRERPRIDWYDVIDRLSILVSPWAEWLEKWHPTELIVCPHSLLAMLPLHAAPWHGQPLIDSFPVSYLPSPALAREIGKHARPRGKRALLVGNPTDDLGGAGMEVARIKDCLEKSGVECCTLVGSQATTAAVGHHASAASLLHFACHSVLDVYDFQRSGFALADRRLTAFDITATIHIPQASLVYLNSCHSGRSMPTEADELMALMRVFLYAGAASAIATLFTVPDDAAYAFAEHFYQIWLLERTSRTQAFQQAMKATRELYPDPSCWAPFVLVGAWQEA